MYEHLKELRETLGLTQAEFGRSVGIAKSTYNNYETGIRDPKSDFWVAVAKKYGVTIDYLMGYSDDPHRTGGQQSKSASVISTEAQQVAISFDKLDVFGKRTVRAVIREEQARIEEVKNAPIIPHPATLELLRTEQPASAGQGTYLGPERFELLRVLDTPLTRRASFSVPVSGNSMEPHYRDGDTLLIESAEELKPGEIGLFSLDGEGYVKKLGHGELISLNPAYPPIPLDESIRLHGRVIGVLDPNSLIG